MYEKRIETLLKFKAGNDAATQAINSAIELMRSAEPKNEVAEREHCSASMKSIGFTDADGEPLPDELDWLLRERAAVRAESAAQYRAVVAECMENWRAEQVASARLETKLTNLRAAASNLLHTQPRWTAEIVTWWRDAIEASK